MKTLLIKTTILSTLAITPAIAENIYTGVEIGSFNIKPASKIGRGAIPTKFKTTSGFVGYNLNDTFAIEAGYTTTDKVSHTPPQFPAITRISVTSVSRFKGYHIDLVAKTKTSTKGFYALGSLGLGKYKSRVILNITTPWLSESRTFYRNLNGKRLGLGIGYDFGNSWDVRAMARRISFGDDVFKSATSYTVGFTKSF